MTENDALFQESFPFS